MRNLLEYLDNTAARYPDKLAFAGGDGRDHDLKFSELNELSIRIGSFLSGKGFFRQPVAILMEKSPEEVSAFFGTWRAGCFYVPLDAEMPKLRMIKIMEHVSPKALIYDESLKELALELAAKQPGIAAVSYPEAASAKEEPALLDQVRKKALDIDPAYIVFTSGSTGMPKGVIANHRSVIDYIETLDTSLEFSENSVFASQTPLYFDACLKEVMTVIRCGATAWFVPKKLFMLPVQLVEYLNGHQVNTICWVVSALTFISSLKTFEKITPTTLRTIAFGSEVFPKKQFALWKEACPEAVFFNLYGPTECTGMSCFYKLERELSEEEPIPIGEPFPNTEVLLLKEDGTLAGEGEEGEICLRGTCVTLGYYGDPERTAEAFVQNPLQKAYAETIYKTGDIGKYNDHGELIFVSRKDRQIKHMGHRIELGEIEAAGDQLEGITECAAVYDEGAHKIKFYYSGDIDKGTAVVGLKELLPRYMVPNITTKLERLPHTPNGKIDRKALKQ